jgi:DNA-binding response OmpR family regulator
MFSSKKFPFNHIPPDGILPGQIPASSGSMGGDLPARTANHPILLTDDEPLILDLYQVAFAVSNWTTIRTCSAVDALDYCHRLPISLVISDVMKPGLNGFDMLKQLKADPTTTHIPVLFVSAGAGRERHQMATGLGAAGYLVKPVRMPELLNTVHHILVEHGNWQTPKNVDTALLQWLTRPDPKMAEALGKMRPNSLGHKKDTQQ